MIVERTPKPDLPDPFDITAVMLHCRIDDDVSGLSEATQQARAAALELEAYAALALLDQTIRVTLDFWPRKETLALPIAPLLDVLSVTVLADGEPFEAFSVTAGQRPAIRLTGPRPCGVVVIEYEAGFGLLAADIPADLSLAIMEQAAAFYDDRGAGNGKTNCMSPHTARIAARYRRVTL